MIINLACQGEPCIVTALLKSSKMMKIFLVLMTSLMLQVVSCQKKNYIRSQFNRMPKTMRLVLNYSNNGSITFNFIKIPDNVDKTKVVVGDKAGVHEEKEDKKKHFSMYRDTSMYAAFTVTDNSIENKKGYSYYGSFRFNSKIYSLEPVYPGESTVENALDRNYKIEIYGIKYHLRGRDEKTDKGVGDKSVNRTDSRTVNQNRKGSDKKFVGEKQILTVEVLMILDYSIYNKWMKLLDNDKHKAIENMKFYYSEIANGIKMRYEGISIPNYMFTVALAGFYIAETPDMVPFIEDRSITHNNYIDYIKALRGFTNWAISPIREKLPRFDVAALFTNYQMKGINGIAYVSGVCLSNGVSINRDTGPFQSADTAAHEIGHNLGSVHDSENNTCLYRDQYIMAGGRSGLIQENYDNLFLFSRCSLNYFSRRIYTLNKYNQNCLEDYPSTDQPLYAEKYFKTRIGQTYSLDYQCKIVVDHKSYLCSDGNTESSRKICYEIGCYSPSYGSCVSIRPANRTSCGLNSWCIKGRCVKDPKAPVFKDKCILGDSTRPLDINRGRRMCTDVIKENPDLCNQESYKKLCCESCDKVENTKNKNCPFGDWIKTCNKQYCKSPYYRIACCKTCDVKPSEKLVRSRCKEESMIDWCQGVDSPSCYTSHDLCCTNCAKFYDPSVKGCEYGNHGSWCSDRVKRSPNDCNSKSISEKCCKSCKGVTGKTVRPHTGTTKPSRTTRPSGCKDKEDCKSILAWHCYTPDIRGNCCGTCKTLEISQDPKCKYGDHASWCYEELYGYMELCDDKRQDYHKVCCDTCRKYKRNR